MLALRTSAQFRRDYRRCAKRGHDMALLSAAIVTLRIPAALPEKNRDHSLTGNTVANCYGIVNMVFDSFSAVDLPDSWERIAVGTHADLFGG